MTKSIALWALALVLMIAAGGYQRRTGPTYEVKSALTLDGATVEYELPRSEETVRRARVALPLPTEETTGRVYVKRYPTSDSFTPLEMTVEETERGKELVAHLPVQPAAGKVEYYVEVASGTSSARIPEVETEEPSIILRYKDPVPLPLLLSHVLMMFFAMMIGMRTALGAVAGEDVRRLAWVTLGLMTVGGMILGPFVQKYAFGAYWTGFPWGYDLTDNKTLLMWLAWIAACGALFLGKERKALGRAAVMAAAVVTMVVYLIPHSLRGSELDYESISLAPPADGIYIQDACRRAPLLSQHS